VIQDTFSIARSRELLERSDQILVRGCQGHKRNHQMLERGYPVFVARAEGARFYDVDGQSCLDYLLGFGPIVLGHADPAVSAAVTRQMADGLIFTTAHEKEVAIAERVLSCLPWAARLGFVIGGSAATSAAVRLARAHTGRDVLLRCGYHGWHDWTAPNPIGVPDAVRDISIAFPYADLQALEDLLKANDGKVACVIVETVQDAGPPEGYLQGVVDLAHRYGALAIFDEVKAGCRIAIGGATEYYDVVPDMATYGKAWCNGFPAAFVAGREEVLGSDACQEAWLAATFHCELASFAAMEVVLDRLRDKGGIAHQARLGSLLKEEINRVCEEHDVPYRLVGADAMPQPVIPEDKPRAIRWLQGALRRGHYLHPGHCMFLSLAHTEADVAATVAAAEESAREMNA